MIIISSFLFIHLTTSKIFYYILDKDYEDYFI